MFKTSILKQNWERERNCSKNQVNNVLKVNFEAKKWNSNICLKSFQIKTSWNCLGKIDLEKIKTSWLDKIDLEGKQRRRSCPDNLVEKLLTLRKDKKILVNLGLRLWGKQVDGGKQRNSADNCCLFEIEQLYTLTKFAQWVDWNWIVSAQRTRSSQLMLGPQKTGKIQHHECFK